MSDYLVNLTTLKGYKKSSRRVGRGIGSTKGGHTAGRGSKGQKARTGGGVPIWFEGGQNPLVHKMPYRPGFKNHNAKDILAINLSQLSNFKHEGEITPELLAEKGVIPNVRTDGVKILGVGTVDKKVQLKGFIYSKLAKSKIESAGGTAE